MESFSSQILGITLLFLLASVSQGQLDSNFYSTSCPNLQTIVSSGMQTAISSDTRIAASILRLHFHDCFVNGCDGSVLLDDTSTFTGEKTARPNQNSLRGFDVIDTIKSSVEAQCNATVSCADILALAALEGVKQVNGPTWTLGLGRRDARTASLATANSDLPPPTANLSALLNFFSNKNLDATDLTALSGAHTIGQARCTTFRGHIYNDTDIDSTFAATRQANCPFSTDGTGDNNLAPLDVSTQDSFDNGYFQNLVAQQGLLHSDQELYNGGSQDSLVSSYSTSQSTFFSDFAAAMTKMSNLSPLTGSNGEIRLNCRVVN